MTADRASPAAPDVDRGHAAWGADPDAVEPVVLVIGGFMSSPPVYRRLAARLRRRGAVAVLVAPVWTPDWVLVTVRGMRPIVTRAGRALLRAGELSRASRRSLGAPVLVVGHSAGGVTARLLTSPEPFEGMRLGAAGRIGAIVTLGSPHHVARDGDIGSRIGSFASMFADRVVPGAAFAPHVGYVSVSARGVVGRLDGEGRAGGAYRFYHGLLGSAAEGRDTIEGDGLVPVESALLDGARQLVLDDTTHGPTFGAPWYCSDERIDRWWPAAIEAWHEALRVRVAGRFQVPSPAPPPPDVPPVDLVTKGLRRGPLHGRPGLAGDPAVARRPARPARRRHRSRRPPTTGDIPGQSS